MELLGESLELDPEQELKKFVGGLFGLCCRTSQNLSLCFCTGLSPSTTQSAPTSSTRGTGPVPVQEVQEAPQAAGTVPVPVQGVQEGPQSAAGVQGSTRSSRGTGRSPSGPTRRSGPPRSSSPVTSAAGSLGTVPVPVQEVQEVQQNAAGGQGSTRSPRGSGRSAPCPTETSCI